MTQVFDPFALIPTDTFVPLKAEKLDTYVPQLVPQLPPQNYDNKLNKETKANTDNDALFSHFLNKAVQQTIPPLYEYTFEQEKRYSNPYLQFNPKPLGGYDTEDIYGKFQGVGEQLWNSLVKTGANAATSFISSFTTLGPSIDALRQGKPFDEDSVLGETQGWLRELENDYPNYYTQWEREHPFKSAFTPVGITNFWGDKVLKNVGFTIGSLASSLLVDAGITLATEGTAAPATLILAANQIRRAIAPLKNIFRGLTKVSTLNKVNELRGVARVGEGISNGLRSMNQAYNFKKAAQFAGTTYFAAQGEAMIEGYQTYWQTKEDLYKQELAKGELDLNRLSEIETFAQEAANTTTALNLPVIMASNLLQFPTIFAGKSLLKQFDSPFLKIVNKEGLTAVNNYSRKQAWVNTMKEFTKDFLTEGGEEGYQYYIGNSIHDYYIDKFNGTASNSLSNFLAQQLPKKVQEEGFWESTIIGGLAGGLMGSVHTFKKNLIGANERTERAKEVLQPILDRFNSTVKDYVHFAENVEHQADGEATNAFQSAHKALFSTVHDSLKYGVFDNFQDSLEDLREIPLDEYNKLFGTELNETERFNHLSKVQQESLRIKQDLTNINKFYQTNPFDSPYVTQRLRDIYKIDQTQVDNVKVQLFNEFKELVGYNVSRLRNTKDRIDQIEQELKTYGLEGSIIPVLYNLATPKGISQYRRLKQVQLQALEDEVEYYKELESESPELTLKVKNLKSLIKKLEKVNPEKQQEELQKIIFEEEIGLAQMIAEEEFLKKQEELRKQQELAVKTAEDLETQTTEPEQKAKEQVETVSKMVPPEEKKVQRPIISPNIFNKNFNSLNEGDTFRLSLATEEGEFTLITKHPFVAEKDGVRYHFTPQGATRYPEGDLIRYALDSIGVEKVDKFVDKGEVSPEEVETITEKITKRQPLTEREQEQRIEKKEEVETKLKKQKTVLEEQQKIKEATKKLRKNPTKPVKDGIYLINRDNKFAWRYIDENTAVPLTLKLKGNKLIYEGDMERGIEKRIEQGHLLDDKYIQEEKEEEKEEIEVMLGIDITSILEERTADKPIKGKDLTHLLQQKDNRQNQLNNLDKFLTEPISESLRAVLEFRVGRGIQVEC